MDIKYETGKDFAADAATNKRQESHLVQRIRGNYG